MHSGKKQLNGIWLAAALILVALLAAFAVFRLLSGEELPEVSTLQVQSGPVYEKVMGSGKVVASGITELKMPRSEQIRAVMVREGDEVKSGDVLFVLGTGDSGELETARDELHRLQEDYHKAAADMPSFDMSQKEKAVDTARALYEQAKAQWEQADAIYRNIVGTAPEGGSEDLKAAKEAAENARFRMEEADAALFYARSELASARSNVEKEYTVSSIELQSLNEQIKIQQDKIKSLAGDMELAAPEGLEGYVGYIGAEAGDTLSEGTVVCRIMQLDAAYTLSFRVTAEQSRLLRLGDTVELNDFPGAGLIKAELISILADPADPGAGMTITFRLEGDVKEGSELSLSVGSRSRNYDLVIPNYALSRDSRGSYVLAVKETKKIFGKGYEAKRVDVKILAGDDENSALKANLEAGDFIISASSEPLENGDRISFSGD